MAMAYTSTAFPNRIAIAGLGLIGGSVLKALRQTGYKGHITAFDVDRDSLLAAQDFLDASVDKPEALFRDHDLVVLCMPVSALLQLMNRHGGAMTAGGATIIDVASVKAPIAAALNQWGAAASARFVPCHPIAGKAIGGWAAADAQLFEGKLCVITPGEHTSPESLELVCAFWRALGTHLTTMPAVEHDKVYAAISHTPQVLTYAYLHSLANRDDSVNSLASCGPGFQSFTRLGGSDARLWADIAIHNARALVDEIDRLSDSLALVRQSLVQKDFSELEAVFAKAHDFHAISRRANGFDTANAQG